MSAKNPRDACEFADAWKEAYDHELEGAAALRADLGAKDEETFQEFVRRVARERDESDARVRELESEVELRKLERDELGHGLRYVRAALCKLADVEDGTGETTLELVRLVELEVDCEYEQKLVAEKDRDEWQRRYGESHIQYIDLMVRLGTLESTNTELTAKLAAWEPVVRASIDNHDKNITTGALGDAVESLPLGMRPGESE